MWIDVVGEVGLKSTLVTVKEVDENKEHEEHGTDQPVDAEDNDGSVRLDEHAAEDGAAKATKTVVKTLQKTLCVGSQLGVCIMGNKRAAGGPNSSVSDALDELERQYQPGPCDEGYVDKPDHVAE